jgi:hypothetical protein
MKEVEYLEDLKVGELVYLIGKDGKTKIVVRLDSDISGLKGRYVKSQYPISGQLEYISDKDWDNLYHKKYRISGESSWYKEYKEI